MLIALFGGTGQLGQALQDVLEDDLQVIPRSEVDLALFRDIAPTIERIRPDVVINAAAYTAVDQAEQQFTTAYSINAFAVQEMAKACERLAIPLVHIGTDYVFGLDRQRNTPYTENDLPGPINIYGQTKLAGEYAARANCSRHFVLRVSGLFGQTKTPGTGNFIETILRLANERDRLAIVNDQHVAPTSALDLANVIDRLLRTEAYGLYHVSSRGETTWYGFAQHILSTAGIERPIDPISSEDFSAPATRPHYSILDPGRIEEVIDWTAPDWKTSVDNYLAERT